MSHSYTNVSATVVQDACEKYIDDRNAMVIRDRAKLVNSHLTKCRKRWWSTIRTEEQARKALSDEQDFMSPWQRIELKHTWDFDKVYRLLKLAKASQKNSPMDATIYLTSADAALLHEYLT